LNAAAGDGKDDDARNAARNSFWFSLTLLHDGGNPGWGGPEERGEVIDHEEDDDDEVRIDAFDDCK
jgi:hypothetical protein